MNGLSLSSCFCQLRGTLGYWLDRLLNIRDLLNTAHTAF
jgi:hypothetical protein